MHLPLKWEQTEGEGGDFLHILSSEKATFWSYSALDCRTFWSHSALDSRRNSVRPRQEIENREIHRQI